jgi:heat-inducible transcriptional repressor
MSDSAEEVVELNRRRSLILKAVVEEHIRSGQPVGSGVIVRHYGLEISPATVRNELVRLEDGGYVTQPHTSAGRTPSDLGYRFYVDHLMPAPEESSDDHGLIRRYLSRYGRDVRNAVKATARFLADVTSYVAVVLAPDGGTHRLRQMHLLPLDNGQALVVIVLDGGLVQHRLMALPGGMDLSSLEGLSRELQAALSGCTAQDLPAAVSRLWRSSLARYGEALEAATQAVIDVLGADHEGGERIFLGGTANILSVPEFQDVERLRGVLNLLEREATLFGLLEERAAAHGLSVTIGRENPLNEISSCSLVTLPYRTAAGARGIIGLLGPTRMDYGRVVSLLTVAGRHLDEAPGSGG